MHGHEGWPFVFNEPFFKKVAPAGLNSLQQKGYQISVKKTGFLMIHSLKRDQYWSFWHQGWSDHQVQEVLWWNEAVEVIEATEVIEVIEAAEVLRPGKSLLRTSESSRLKNSALSLCFFLEKKSLVDSWNIKLELSAFSIWDCWGQPVLLFF